MQRVHCLSYLQESNTHDRLEKWEKTDQVRFGDGGTFFKGPKEISANLTKLQMSVLSLKLSGLGIDLRFFDEVSVFKF